MVGNDLIWLGSWRSVKQKIEVSQELHWTMQGVTKKQAICHTLACNFAECWLIFSEPELTFAICYRPSICCPSVCLSVTFVRPQAVQIFRSNSKALGTLAICCHPPKISRRSSQGNPSTGGVKRKRVAKYSDFGPVDGYISETVQDRR